MVFFNYAAMQMVAKIVYYGPGLCGKTTNLKLIYERTTPISRGEIVSLETETDRTLFFDLLPIDVGVIGGFKTKFQLYTVPGQVFYNVTRKLVLKGVDGIVFVADSQAPMLDANIESFQNLRDNLNELGIPIEKTPIVLQYNKRDLQNISSVAKMEKGLNPNGNYVSIESSALTGFGIFETLKEISRQTLLKLKTKVVDQEERKKRESIVSFKVQTEELSEDEHEDLDDVTDETMSNLDDSYEPPVLDDTIPEGEASLPSISLHDAPGHMELPIGESSLPSVKLSDIDVDGAEIEIDTSDEFDVDGSDWDQDDNELSLDFEFSDEPSGEDEENESDSLEEEELDSVEMEVPSTSEKPSAEDKPPPAPSMEVIEPNQVEPAVEKRKVKSKLDELANLTKAPGKRTGKNKPSQDILGNFLSSVSPKSKKKEKRIPIITPTSFDTAQLNCIFVDGSNNVIHTQLVKVMPTKLPNGKKEIRVVLEVEEES